MSGTLLIIGSGGHGRSVLDVALASRRFGRIVFASNEDDSHPVPGFELLDEREMSPRDIAASFDGVVVAIGDNRTRLAKIRALCQAGVNLPTLIHPSAVVSASARVAEGVVVFPHATVNAFSSVGAGCIVNTASVVEHDCVLGDGVHVSPGAVMGGGARIGEGVWLCIGSAVSDHKSIASWSTLAGGSVLVSEAAEPGLYVGVPAELKRKLPTYDTRG